MFTGRFTPQGGYDVGNYTPCLRALAQEALAPYFSGHRVEVMRVTQAHPFGVAAARQATSAVLITYVPRAGGAAALCTALEHADAHR